MLKKDLQGWFKSHPAISIRQFGIECGYADGGRFRRWIKEKASKNEEVSEQLKSKILPVLKKYGYAELS